MLTMTNRCTKGRPAPLCKMLVAVMVLVCIVLVVQVNAASSSPHPLASRTASSSSSSSIDAKDTFHNPSTSSSRPQCAQRLSKIRHLSTTIMRRRRRSPLSLTLSSNALMVRGGGGGGGSSSTSSHINTVGVFADWVASSKGRSWAVLFTSIMFDTVSTALMKHARETSSTTKLCLAFLGYFCSLSGLALSMKAINVSIAYATWAGLGTAIVSVAGAVLFKEKMTVSKVCCLCLIVLGVIGLEVTDGH